MSLILLSDKFFVNTWLAVCREIFLTYFSQVSYIHSQNLPETASGFAGACNWILRMHIWNNINMTNYNNSFCTWSLKYMITLSVIYRVTMPLHSVQQLVYRVWRWNIKSAHCVPIGYGRFTLSSFTGANQTSLSNFCIWINWRSLSSKYNSSSVFLSTSTSWVIRASSSGRDVTHLQCHVLNPLDTYNLASKLRLDDNGCAR